MTISLNNIHQESMTANIKLLNSIRNMYEAVQYTETEVNSSGI